VHHSAEQLDFLVNTRMQPVELVWSRMVMLTPIFALGLDNPVRFDDGLIAAAVLLLGSMWGCFIHSNIRWRLGPFEWLLTTLPFITGVTPTMASGATAITRQWFPGSTVFSAPITCPKRGVNATESMSRCPIPLRGNSFIHSRHRARCFQPKTGGLRSDDAELPVSSAILGPLTRHNSSRRPGASNA
jgi:hypothetical protein